MSDSTKIAFRLQSAALAGLEKLEKYFSIARDHHAYILGTSKSHFYSEISCN